MEFFDTAYLYFSPVLLLLSFIVKKPNKYFILNILAIVNILLVFNSIYIIRQYYGWYKLAMELNLKPDPNLKIEIGWQQIKDWLIILLPFLFLIKPISCNRILVVVMIFLLKYNWFSNVYSSLKHNNSISCSHYYEYHFCNKIMHYTSWVLLLYALFWFINYLPFNKKWFRKLSNK